MSEGLLPEDLSLWPDSPQELLGVRPGCTAKELKRSYTRLIRQFKPEHYPEHFRRIRDAYEHVQRYLEFFAHYDLTQEPSDQPESEGESSRDKSRDDGDPSEATDHFHYIDRDFSSRSSTVEDVDSLWKLAIQGDEEAAYRGLVSLQDRNPTRPAILLRLYWLLLLNRALDPSREPADWLVRGLGETRLMGPLAEVYRQYISWFPQEAFSERFDRLMQCDATPNRLAEVLSWRWQEALMLERWNIIGDDLALLRSRIQPFDEEGWLQLLLKVIDTCAWMDDPRTVQLYQVCREELRDYKHLSVRRGEWFDRCEYLESLVAGWRKVRRPPLNNLKNSFLELVRHSWNRPLPEIDRRLRAVIESIHADHVGWLRMFDEMNAISPALISQFGNLLRNYEIRMESYNPFPSDVEQFFTFVGEMIDSYGYSNLSHTRIELMKLCIREWIQLEWLDPLFERWIGQQNVASYHLRATLAARISNDWSLRYIYWAERTDRLNAFNRALFEVWSVVLADYEWSRLEDFKDRIVIGARNLMTTDAEFVDAITTSTSSLHRIRIRFSKVRELLEGCGE